MTVPPRAPFPAPSGRGYQAVRWNEPIVTELSTPGQRGLVLPEPEPDVAAGLAAALEAIPAALRRSVPPGLPELAQPLVLRHFLRLSQMSQGAHLVADTLGTCTMKYSPLVGELIARTPRLRELHPDQDPATVQGLLEIVWRCDQLLRAISGFDAFSFQGGGGSQGIYTSALVIRAWHEMRGEGHRRDEIITTTFSHPANAAAAATAGFRVISLMPGDRGFPDVEALRAAISPRTAGLMITNPEDTGIFNPHVGEFVRLVHEAGGLAAYDQANGNPLLGMARAADAGFDLGQFNLHKTFGAPHNSIGPGSSAVGVRSALEPFLPSPVVRSEGDAYVLDHDRPQSVGRVRAWAGNFQVVVRAYAWILALGAEGLRTVAQTAVLNNNYLAHLLKTIPGLDIPYEGSGPRLDQIRWSWAGLTQETGVTSDDIVRRTTDFGLQPYYTSHHPMLVAEPMTLEPTEMVSKADLEELAAVLAAIAGEARSTPETVRTAPHRGPVAILDEAAADDPEAWAMTWRALVRKRARAAIAGDADAPAVSTAS
jgi:glycine dehydrogenase subunit 2